MIWKNVLQCYKLGKTESERMFYVLHVALTCATAPATLSVNLKCYTAATGATKPFERPKLGFPGLRAKLV